jgi:pimeloyl-ACP methyl ester carboxylesterase
MTRSLLGALTLTLVLAFGACSDDSGGGPDAATSPDSGGADLAIDASAAACKGDGSAEVVTMTADDGQKIEGDLYLGGAVNAPAVVLLHMIPPSNTRANYPKQFIDKLVAKGLTVLNIDRRGAGGSTPGTAVDAYTGVKGKLDAKAAYDFLKAHSCAIDLTKVAYIGASNGTTTALDFTVYANGESTVELPKALVFLTGGGYTETNNWISTNKALLETIPMLFVYSDTEATWSVQFESGKPAIWTFSEYSPGGHGTQMFAQAQQSMDDVADWVGAQLK